MQKIVLIFLLNIVCVQAQLTANWTPRSDLNASLPASIRVFEDKSIPAWYILADPKDTTNYVFRSVLSGASGGTEVVSSMARTNKAFAAINGGYFGGGASYSLVIQDGKQLVPNIKVVNRSNGAYSPTRAAFGLSKDKTPDAAWIYDVNGTTYSYPNPSLNTQSSIQAVPSATFPAGGSAWKMRDAIGGGPMLVQNKAARVTWENEAFFGSGVESNIADPRSAIGYTADGKLILMVVDGRSSGRGATLPDMAKLMLDLGAVEAINLDGGGSSTMVVNNTLINRPSDGTERRVATAILLMPKSTRDTGTSGKIFDTGDSCCYAEKGIWFESANTPFWGATKSRLNEAGTGTDEATFTFKDIETALYDVYAWWVPAPNRAKNAPFTISAKGTKKTVNMDQTDALSANVWNLLGTFNLQNDDFVTLTDQATGNTTPAYVVADAIRLVKKSGSVTNEHDETPKSEALLEAFPNPSSQFLSVRVNTSKPEMITLSLYDLLGRKVFEKAFFNVNKNTQILNLQELRTGRYFLQMTSETHISQKTIILHN